ncbi:TRAP transporter small permease [Siminovitchia acidinfaciens]|uniref:TRAP transporter small permease n=1 Tax=Siminovitchia acidinfaciens TaxID=2321395 RepID=A0A429Y6Z7_9BACI|nr:TRAP transporter small permease [Siminovitchia acidinfaciens]RST77237.1 TRAP transporter small permease [Siminovitchia acidinfaciens]
MRKAVDRVTDAFGIVGIFLIIALCVLVLLEIINRNMIHLGMDWTIEMTEYMLAFITFCGAGWLLKADGHIKFDMITERLPQRYKRAARILSSSIGFLITSLLTVFGFYKVINLLARGIVTETVLELPQALLIAIVPLGLLIASLQFLFRIIDAVNEVPLQKEESA